jgi:hypothetical protein
MRRHAVVRYLAEVVGGSLRMVPYVMNTTLRRDNGVGGNKVL